MADGGVPAGWYPDPQGSGNLRYWDGVQWTEHLQPVPQPQQPAAPTPQPAQPIQAPQQPIPQPVQQPAQQPGGPVTPPPPPAHGGSLQLKPPVILAGFGGLVMIISTLLPWASDDFDSVNGFEKNLPWPVLGTSSGSEGTIGSGIFFLLLGIAAVGLAYLLLQKNESVAVPLIVVGAVVVLYTVWTAVKFNDEFGDFGVDIGFGLWLCLVGAALVVAGGIAAFVQKS